MTTITQIRILQLEKACDALKNDIKTLEADLNCVQFRSAKNVLLNMLNVKKGKLERMKILKNFNISNLTSEDRKLQKIAEEME